MEANHERFQKTAGQETIKELIKAGAYEFL